MIASIALAGMAAVVVAGLLVDPFMRIARALSRIGAALEVRNSLHESHDGWLRAGAEQHRELQRIAIAQHEREHPPEQPKHKPGTSRRPPLAPVRRLDEHERDGDSPA